MKQPSTPFTNLPPEQEAIRAKCFHASGTFEKFPTEDVEKSIPDRFEKIVRQYRDQPAIKWRERLLTYEDVNQAANRIARAILMERGAGNEPIAILFENPLDFIAATFGVLKAGKFCVSLEPTHPYEMLQSLLEDSQAGLIVTNKTTALRVYPPDTLPFRVLNNYGPTECTVVVTSAQVRPNAHPLVPPTIGRPMANSQVYILDAHRNPVPIGVAGEIYIGGDRVARGYLNRPEMTAERFIHHSFDGKPKQRLYKSGDVARYMADGNIEFLGRVDNQVKIRGCRIELGEIEAVLSQHPSVWEAVVVAQNEASDKRLIAYVVHRHGADISVNELRGFLKQKLPEYMIPSVFIVLDVLPLTPNGKLDRKALPLPDRNRPELEQSFVTPHTPIEEIIAEIWAEVLKVEKVGVHDNFFDLGGHSLLATQVMSRMREAFQTAIPLRTLFEKPMIEELAIAIMHANGERISKEELYGMLDNLESLSEDEVKQRLV